MPTSKNSEPLETETVESCRQLGNDCVKSERYFEASLHYTRAIKLEGKNPQLYSNRSLALRKCCHYYQAFQDADTAVRLAPKWAKGYFRQAEVLFDTQNYEKAVEAFLQAEEREATDVRIKEHRQNAESKLANQRLNESRVWLGCAVGALVGICLVVADLTSINPTLTNSILQFLLIGSFSGLGYGIALSMRYMIQTQRKALLDAPLDLLGDEKPSQETSSKMTSEAKTRKPASRRNMASQRQKMKHS